MIPAKKVSGGNPTDPASLRITDGTQTVTVPGKSSVKKIALSIS